jgi:hypothetical protein
MSRLLVRPAGIEGSAPVDQIRSSRSSESGHLIFDETDSLHAFERFGAWFDRIATLGYPHHRSDALRQSLPLIDAPLVESPPGKTRTSVHGRIAPDRDSRRHGDTSAFLTESPAS